MSTPRLAALLLLSTMATTAGPAAAQAEGEPVTIGHYHTIASRVLGEQRTVMVYLPEGQAGSQEACPVLYLLDAGEREVFAHAVFTTWYLSRMAQHIPGLGRQIPDMIVVAIASTDRQRDFWPVRSAEDGGTRNVDDFLRFLRDELVPFVDGRYRTTSRRVLFGQSLGSVFARYAFLRAPDVFDVCIASSAGFPGCKDFLFALAERSFEEKAFRHNLLFMTSGKRDPYYERHEATLIPEFVALLGAKAPRGLRWEYEVYPEEGHVPIPSLRDGLRWAFSHPVEVSPQGSAAARSSRTRARSPVHAQFAR